MHRSLPAMSRLIFLTLAVCCMALFVDQADSRTVSRQRARKFDHYGELEAQNAIRRKRGFMEGVKTGLKYYKRYRPLGAFLGRGLNTIADMFKDQLGDAAPWINRVGGGLRAAAGDPFGMFEMAPEIWDRSQFFPPRPYGYNPYYNAAYGYGMPPPMPNYYNRGGQSGIGGLIDQIPNLLTPIIKPEGARNLRKYMDPITKLILPVIKQQIPGLLGGRGRGLKPQQLPELEFGRGLKPRRYGRVQLAAKKTKKP